MGLAGRYPSTRATLDTRAADRVSAVTLPALIAILLAGTFILVVGAVYFGLWFSRYNAERKDREAREDTLSVQGDFTPIGRRSSSRKLQKAGWQAMRSEETLVPGCRNHQRSLTLPMIPRVFSMRLPSRSWAATGSDIKNGKTPPPWIDADALHGPAINTYPGGRARESWPLGPMPPTIPKLYHTVHGYPHSDNSRDGDSLQGIDHVRSAYGQLRMFSRVLPEPPQPALVASHNRQLSRAASTGHGGYFNGELQRQISGSSSNNSSPVRSLPPTPTKIRPRQPSTDTTLSNILKSTERRLQEVAGSRNGGMASSPNRMGTSRESLLIHTEPVGDGRRLSRSLTQPRTPSPNKTVPTRSATMGHKRLPSEASIISETDSALEELLVQSPDAPSGLSSPSRNKQTQQEPEQVIPPAQSARSSVSSALSTVYSEDERSEAGKTANNTPCGAAAERVKNIMVRPESMGDPFSNSPRPLAAVGLPAPPKGPGLFRESLERSQRQRRMTLGQPATLPPEVKLPPCPVIAGRKSLALPPPASAENSHGQQPKRTSSPPTTDPSAPLSKIPVKINPISQQQAANLAKLSAIILPPPTTNTLPIPLLHPRPTSPGLRRRSSISSSVYSQDPPVARQPSPAALNTAAVHSNHILPPLFQSNPPVLPPLFRSTAPTPSPPPRSTLFDPMDPDTYRSSSPHRPLTLTIAELRRMNSAVSIASSVSDGYGREGSPSVSPLGLLTTTTPVRKRVSRGEVFSPGSGGSRAYLALGSASSSPEAKAKRHSSRIGRSGSPRRRVGSVSKAVSGSRVGYGFAAAVVGGGAGEDQEKENREGDPFETPSPAKQAPKGPRVPAFTFAVHGEDGVAESKGDGKGLEEKDPGSMATTSFKRRRFDDDLPGGSAVVWESPAKRLARRGSQESLGLYDADGFLISTPLRKKVATAGNGVGGGANPHKVQGSPLRGC